MLFTNKKKTYFKNELAKIERTIWQLEFQRFKVRELREDIRREYDRSREVIDALNAEIKGREDKGEHHETVNTLKEKREGFLKDVAQFEEQMKALDNEVSGDNQEAPSIEARIDGLQRLGKMMESYMKAEF